MFNRENINRLAIILGINFILNAWYVDGIRSYHNQEVCRLKLWHTNEVQTISVNALQSVDLLERLYKNPETLQKD